MPTASACPPRWLGPSDLERSASRPLRLQAGSLAWCPGADPSMLCSQQNDTSSLRQGGSIIWVPSRGPSAVPAQLNVNVSLLAAGWQGKPTHLPSAVCALLAAAHVLCVVPTFPAMLALLHCQCCSSMASACLTASIPRAEVDTCCTLTCLPWGA